MADVKAVELVEGARIIVKCTVNENLEKGRRLNDAKAMRNGKSLIRSVTEKDTGKVERWIERQMPYPFPAGLIQDPLTKKPARTDMTPADIAKAVADWQKQLELLVAAEGRYTMVNAEGKTLSGVTVLTVPGGKNSPGPVSVLPSVFGESGVFGKGFKLAIQGDVNAAMADEFIVIDPKVKPIKTKATSFDPDAAW